jgi:hypothetical protein
MHTAASVIAVTAAYCEAATLRAAAQPGALMQSVASVQQHTHCCYSASSS